jgi:hypothetical protein
MTMTRNPDRRAILAGLAATSALVGSTALAQGTLPKIVVTKDPNCGCCGGWVDHLRASGFVAEVIEDAALNRTKIRLGVPRDLGSCHTGEIDGYLIEGHVPASAIKRLLSQRPQARGLAVPGMPVGSPGMEVDGMEPETYEVILFGPAGQRTFAKFRGAVEA